MQIAENVAIFRHAGEIPELDGRGFENVFADTGMKVTRVSDGQYGWKVRIDIATAPKLEGE